MTAAASATASPLSMFTSRVKPIDVAELTSVAEILSGASGATGATTATATATATAATPTVAETVGATGAQGSAPTTTSVGAATANTGAAVGTTARSTQAAATTAATATGAAAAGAVGVPSSNVAPRTTYDYWTKHIAQFSGKYLPDGPTMRPNCGPASVTMALRMIGLDIPGYSGQNSEAVLDKARVLATGTNDTTVGTTDSELETLIGKSGGQWSESNDFGQISDWVKQGIPVVLSGNPAQGWNSRYSSDQVQPFNGGHWVTVSGYDTATGYYIVNDPLSQIGPIYVSEAELKSYNQAHGKLGIAVFR